MEEAKVIAMYTHWRDANEKAFVIMWSDHTWDLIKYPCKDYWVGKKSYKQYMQLNKIISSKMTKDEAMKFINEKFEGLREI